jgi:hypothetical protein
VPVTNLIFIPTVIAAFDRPTNGTEFKNNVLRLALHKIKVNHLPQEKVRQEEIITEIKSWPGREGGKTLHLSRK